MVLQIAGIPRGTNPLDSGSALNSRESDHCWLGAVDFMVTSNRTILCCSNPATLRQRGEACGHQSKADSRLERFQIPELQGPGSIVWRHSDSSMSALE